SAVHLGAARAATSGARRRSRRTAARARLARFLGRFEVVAAPQRAQSERSEDGNRSKEKKRCPAVRRHHRGVVTGQSPWPTPRHLTAGTLPPSASPPAGETPSQGAH